jgi:hypothetical protein
MALQSLKQGQKSEQQQVRSPEEKARKDITMFELNRGQLQPRS